MSKVLALACLWLPAILLASSCVSDGGRGTGNGFCENLSRYAETVPDGQSRTVVLRRGGAWMVDHYKACQRSDNSEASKVFCGWLMENTSAEFMEANINRALSCLQGQEIRGYIGNTGIEYWSGKTKFSSPHIDAEGVNVTLEYFMSYTDDNSEEDYLKITIEAE